ncbi:MAG: hypothetical protein ABI467_26495 [Kofleriaceae bacterium]
MRNLGMVPLLLLVGLPIGSGCAVAEEPAPPDSAAPKAPYWESGSATNEGKSTHLFIVNRSIAILAKHLSLPKAASAYARLTNATCRSRWQLALNDADHKTAYNNWFTWSSHFYDPATGTNYLGNTSPVAYDEAHTHLANARTKLAANDVSGGCYELGLALHYATDITQPMHAANYAATDWPLDLHSHLENRAVDVQNSYVSGDWTTAPTGTADAVLLDTAWASNALWPGMWNALANAYSAQCGQNIGKYYFDHTSCWSGNAGVDAAIGTALRQAEIDTAMYMFAADLH